MNKFAEAYPGNESKGKHRYACTNSRCVKKIPERDSALGVVDSSHDSLSVPSWTFPGLTSEETFKSRSVTL